MERRTSGVPGASGLMPSAARAIPAAGVISTSTAEVPYPTFREQAALHSTLIMEFTRSAFGPKAEVHRGRRHFRKVPNLDIPGSLLMDTPNVRSFESFRMTAQEINIRQS
jgi:uncharacterized protein YceK